MVKDLPIGITETNLMHTDADPAWDLDTKFRMVKEAGVFDYIDKTPAADQIDDYQRCSERYQLPVRGSGWYYTLGRDEPLIEQNIKIAGRLGSRVHNTQIMMYHADGHLVTNEEVFDVYMRAYELGEEADCWPTFEVHVNMWSEDFRRIGEVADMVEARGVPFRMTLDHSHVIFKIDNIEEQRDPYGTGEFNIGNAVESGELILDPFTPGNICDSWIERGYVWHCHARAAVPNNPRNIWAKNPDGRPGRGIQYPFIEPKPGEYHSDWHEERLEPWKEVIRHLMAFHAGHEESPLGQISTEFIAFPDYGTGNGYSLFENAIACAKWLRQTWKETLDVQDGT
jgi:hypothetical protein